MIILDKYFFIGKQRKNIQVNLYTGYLVSKRINVGKCSDNLIHEMHCFMKCLQMAKSGEYSFYQGKQNNIGDGHIVNIRSENCLADFINNFINDVY